MYCIVLYSCTKNFPYFPVPSIPGPKISSTFPYRPFPYEKFPGRSRTVDSRTKFPVVTLLRILYFLKKDIQCSDVLLQKNIKKSFVLRRSTFRMLKKYLLNFSSPHLYIHLNRATASNNRQLEHNFRGPKLLVTFFPVKLEGIDILGVHQGRSQAKTSFCSVFPRHGHVFFRWEGGSDIRLGEEGIYPHTPTSMSGVPQKTFSPYGNVSFRTSGEFTKLRPLRSSLGALQPEMGTKGDGDIHPPRGPNSPRCQKVGGDETFSPCSGENILDKHWIECGFGRRRRGIFPPGRKFFGTQFPPP